MKKTLLLAIVAVCAAVMPFKADGQFRFGPKLGLCLNEMRFSDKALSSDNRAGFTGGVMAEFTAPLIGVGADVSVLYVHRNNNFMASMGDDGAMMNKTAKANYIDIPLNLKWKISIPGVSKIIAPFLTTGPDFAFLCGKSTVENIVKVRSFDLAWNFGFGLQLVNKVQIAASYGLGLTKVLKTIDPEKQTAGIEGKNRYWTVTAAYLF